ncbi:hypothetical protein RJ641_032465 [Dillenia turbinata]|uniref:Uncharacterized protein n=1 Tax=Dillenia turbinata TaxID=194707 RepID=A0AAN8ZIH1_9MAGN
MDSIMYMVLEFNCSMLMILEGCVRGTRLVSHHSLCTLFIVTPLDSIISNDTHDSLTLALQRNLALQELERMHKPQRDSFIINIKGGDQDLLVSQSQPNSSIIFNFSAMKLFDRFRKIVMRLIFSFPSQGSGGSTSRQRTCDRPDPPKTSCSSYYSSNSHYSEAIADCIEFINKSSQEGIPNGRKYNVFV